MSSTICENGSSFWKVQDDFQTFNIDTPEGSCLKIESEFPAPSFLDCSWEQVKTYILGDLTLIPGIGPVHSLELKKKGIHSISDLKNTKWKKDAERISSIIETESVEEIVKMYSSLKRMSDTRLLSLVKNEDVTYFDIETMGMWNAPIILFGCGKYEKDRIKVTQFLVRSLEEEFPALLLSAKMLSSSSTVVTYNGKTFDIPYINERLFHFGERPISFQMHVDLLPYTRKIFRNILGNCRLETVEGSIPSLKRGNDVPGALVPYYYSLFLSSGRKEILYPIMDHNRIDVANLAYLLDYNQRYAEAHSWEK